MDCAGKDEMGQVTKKLKKWQRPLETYLFPAILLLWPLAAVNQGVSVADTTYSLGNYRFIDGVGQMWLLATYLSNELGALLMRLPFGQTMLGMNVMTGLLVSATALCVYYVLRRLMPGWMIFIGEWMAIALCWCPTVILYNYLTYFLVTLACLFLFLAQTAVPKRRAYFAAAGVCLGLNVMARFSNLPQCLLILAVWFYAYIAKESAREVRKDTLACLGGYTAGFGTPLLLLLAQHGAGAYGEMIGSLFGMTAQASDYTLPEMLASIGSAYVHTFRWAAVMTACAVMGLFWLRIPLLARFRRGKRLVYLAGILLLLCFFYGRGMFTVNYQDYWSMFEWGMVFVMGAALLDLLALAGCWGGSPDERYLAAISLLLILITPLGSNNYTFPLLNNLFFIAPFALWMGRRCWQQTRGGRAHFAWHAMALAAVLMVLLQGSLFHVRFAFGDGTDGTARTAQVQGNAFLAGMYTTPDNAAQLSGLSAALQEKAAGQPLVTLGNAPGLHVIFGLPPALSNTWPDLDSYPYEQMAADLAALEKSGARPAVILHTTETEPYAPPEGGAEDADGAQMAESASPAGKKSALLFDFMTKYGYAPVYENEAYALYLAQE